MQKQIFEFEIEGLGDMKMDRWLDDPQPKNEAGYQLQAEKKIYTDKNGDLVIPADAVKAAMRFASSEVGKKMEAKKNRQTIKSTVFFENDLPLGKKEHDGIVRDIVARGVGEKVTRVPTYRPLIKDWKAKGEMIVFGTPEAFIKECLELAGLRYGLLSHRPEFGRFTIKKWKKKL